MSGGSNYSAFSQESIHSAVSNTKSIKRAQDLLNFERHKRDHLIKSNRESMRVVAPFTQNTIKPKFQGKSKYVKDSHVGQREKFIVFAENSEEEEEVGGKRRRSDSNKENEVTIEFLKKKIRDDGLRWGDFKFSKAHVEYLMNNRSLFEEPVL